MKKILMGLIVLLVLIIPNVKVYALEDSFYEGEYIPNGYIVKKRGNSGKYEQMKVFRRKSDNQAVYCIELWEGLQSNVNTIGYDYDQYSYANIDYSVWEKIMLISYYGYGYGNHTDIKWYAITQFMIWQVTSPDSTIYFTDTLNGNRINKYESEMNEINTLIQNHANIPSFYNQSYDINYKQNYTITDTNNVLDKFEIIGDGGLEINKNGNDLTVKSNDVINSQVILVNSDKKYSNPPIVYINPNGQDMLASGSYYPIYMVVNYNVLTSTITLNKMDIDTKSNVSQGDAKLEESKFQLLDIDNVVIQEKVIGEDGKLTFENVGYGNYFIKEVKPGEGYLLNDEILSLEVNEKIENITFYNQVIKNKISFQKYIKNPLTNVIIAEKDAIFSIYNKNNEKIITFNTNEEGKYELELPYGNYIVKQESGTKNHSLVEDFEIKVVENNIVQNFELYNEELTAKIKVINTDSDSNLPILEKGALFKIKDLDTNQYLLDEEDNDLILETTDLGNTDFITLSSGNYQIEQVKAVDGYYINTNIFSFKINDEVIFKLDDNENKYLEIEIPNQKQKSKIEIDKYLEYYLNDNLIKTEKEIDISIPIYAKEDIYSKDGIKLYEKDQKVETAVLNEENVITPLLSFGNYYIKNTNDDKIIEIVLNNLETQKIKLLDKVYEYEEELPDDDNTNMNEQIEEVEITVPNTLTKQSLSSNIDLLLISIGFLIIKKERKNENS